MPEITGELTPTAFDPIGLSLHKMSQGVIAGVDRGLPDVVRLFVLVTDMLVGQTESFFAKKRRNPHFDFAYDRHGKSDEEAFWNDMIGGSEISTMAGPVDLIESLREKFFSELLE